MHSGFVKIGYLWKMQKLAIIHNVLIIFTLLGRNYFASYWYPLACHQSLATKFGAAEERPSSLDYTICNKLLTSLSFLYTVPYLFYPEKWLGERSL